MTAVFVILIILAVLVLIRHGSHDPVVYTVLAEGHCNTSARCDLLVAIRQGRRCFAVIATGFEPLGNAREDASTWTWVNDGRDCDPAENVFLTEGYWRLMDGVVPTIQGVQLQNRRYGVTYRELEAMAAVINTANRMEG